MTGAIIITLAVLATATAFSFVHAGSSKLSHEELQASNARVLREYKRMALHNPEKIVDYQSERNGHARSAQDA